LSFAVRFHRVALIGIKFRWQRFFPARVLIVGGLFF
jgi:hypothetical protein